MLEWGRVTSANGFRGRSHDRQLGYKNFTCWSSFNGQFKLSCVLVPPVATMVWYIRGKVAKMVLFSRSTSKVYIHTH